MGLSPSQPCDHTPVYVLSIDSAWDQDRIAKEIADAKTDAQKLEHPWVAYRRGSTRADFEKVRAWLQPGETPVEFRLQRLTLTRWNEVERLQAGSEPAARMEAIRHSLVGVDGHDIEFTRGGRAEGPLSPADLEAVRALCGHDGWVELGDIAIRVSRGLLDSEKKP